MLKNLMQKVKLFNLVLLFILGLQLHSATSTSQFETIFLDNYSNGKVLPLDTIMQYEGSLSKDNLLDYIAFGRLAILSLQANNGNGNPVEVEKSLADLFNKVAKLNLYKISSKEAFMIGMFSFELMGLPSITTKISFMNQYTLAKDAFNAIQKHKLQSDYQAYVDIMLSIMNVYPTDITNFDYNTVIMQNLSNKKIAALNNDFLKYLAYVYRAMFCKKVNYAKDAVDALEQAKLIYPKAILHVLLEVAWSNGKSTF